MYLIIQRTKIATKYNNIDIFFSENNYKDHPKTEIQGMTQIKVSKEISRKNVGGSWYHCWIWQCLYFHTSDHRAAPKVI